MDIVEGEQNGSRMRCRFPEVARQIADGCGRSEVATLSAGVKPCAVDFLFSRERIDEEMTHAAGRQILQVTRMTRVAYTTDDKNNDVDNL